MVAVADLLDEACEIFFSPSIYFVFLSSLIQYCKSVTLLSRDIVTQSINSLARYSNDLFPSRDRFFPSCWLRSAGAFFIFSKPHKLVRQ